MHTIPHKNILLDIGGTLVSINEHFEAYTQKAIEKIYPFFKNSTQLSKRNFVEKALMVRNAVRAEAHASLIEFSFEYFINRVSRDLDLEITTNIEEIEKEYIFAELAITNLNEGVLDFLEKAKNSNKRLIIATNNFSTLHVRELLVNFSIMPFIDEVFVSGEFGIRKPSVKFIDTICEKLSINKSESIIIGDKLTMDIQAANNSGIESAFYNPERKVEVEQNIPFTFQFSSFNQLEF